jgi:hypothetical protein
MTLGPGWSAMVGLWPSSAIVSIILEKKSLPKTPDSAYGRVNSWNLGSGERQFAPDNRKFELGIIDLILPWYGGIRIF